MNEALLPWKLISLASPLMLPLCLCIFSVYNNLTFIVMAFIIIEIP